MAKGASTAHSMLARGDLVRGHNNASVTSQAPHAKNPKPAMREIARPAGTTFSVSTKIVIAAIQSTFITPPTNNSAIRAQQQPTQYMPCRAPSATSFDHPFGVGHRHLPTYYTRFHMD